MKVLTADHRYQAENVENPNPGQVIQFIEKEPDMSSPEMHLYTLNDGTTNEEVLSILIDRTRYLNDKFPCDENQDAIEYMEEALACFHARTANREKRGVEGTNQE